MCIYRFCQGREVIPSLRSCRKYFFDFFLVLDQTVKVLNEGSEYSLFAASGVLRHHRWWLCNSLCSALKLFCNATGRLRYQLFCLGISFPFTWIFPSSCNAKDLRIDWSCWHDVQTLQIYLHSLVCGDQPPSCPCGFFPWSILEVSLRIFQTKLHHRFDKWLQKAHHWSGPMFALHQIETLA